MTYNRTLVAVLLAGAASLSAVAAQAQTDSQAGAQPFNGFYGGIVGGYSDGRYNFKNAPLFTQPGSPFFGTYGGSTANSAPKLSANGYELGGTFGWNLREGNLVAGVESDLSWSDVNGALNVSDRPSAGTNRFTTRLKGDTRYTGTLRGRLGYTFGPVLAYGTAGFAVQGVSLDRNYSNAAGAQLLDDDKHRLFGFAYGAGAEYAIGNRWSMKGEYLRLDTGSQAFKYSYADGTTGQGKVEANRDLYRIGLNYHF